MIGCNEKKNVKFQCNTHPQIHNRIQLHQAEAFAFLEVLVNIEWPHEGHVVCALLGPSGGGGTPTAGDGTPKESQNLI